MTNNNSQHSLQLLNSEIWSTSPAFQSVIQSLQTKPHTKVQGLTIQTSSLFIAAIIEKFPQYNILFIPNNTESAYINRFTNEVDRALPSSIDIKSLHFDNLLPISGNTGDDQKHIQLSELIHTLKHHQSKVYISSPHILLQYLPEPNAIAEYKLISGQHYNTNNILDQLTSLGYKRVNNVMEVGEFSLRGEILDIFPSSTHLPYRLVFFDSEIESIRHFEPWNQRSINKNLVEASINNYQLINLQSIDSDAIFNKLQLLSNELDESEKVFWEQDLLKFHESGWKRFIPWILSKHSSILEYISPSTLLIVEDIDAIVSIVSSNIETWINQFDKLNQNKLIPNSEKDFLEGFLYYPKNNLKNKIQQHKVLEILP